MLQPLHYGLGLIKNFVKALNRVVGNVKSFREHFRFLSEAEITEGKICRSRYQQVKKGSFTHFHPKWSRKETWL